MPNFRTVNDLAKEVGYTPETIRYDLDRHAIRAEKIGRQWIFTEDQYARALGHYAERRKREDGRAS